MADNRDRPTNRFGYNPFDARQYDSGGFGFGGTSGSAGGYGVGGEGPQTGYASQANYGQGYEPGDYRPEAAEGYLDNTPEERHMSWLDSFPHSFHGWGPNAPDYGPEPRGNPQEALGYTQRTDQRPAQDYGRHRHRNYAREADRWGDEHPDDHHYRAWREQQMRALDDDYLAWREEGRTKFNDDFNEWRNKRMRQRSTGSAIDADEPVDFEKSRS